MITRTIPSTGEKLPVIGLGSWQTFDVSDIAKVLPVLERFLALGGRVIDSSPMYGKSEEAIGKMLAAIKKANPSAPAPFLATKVWTRGKDEGIAQMKRSMSRMGTAKMDLMQIHNLVDWKTQLATLRAWKDAGTIRYIGITHYSHGEFDAMEKIIKSEKIDFVQLPYSVAERGAEKRLLPAAAAAGVAVLVMEPFSKGALFDRVKGKALPAVAKDVGCTSWAQLFLKFIVGHPAVTAPIPATSKVKHIEDNLGALRGPVPTEAQRKQIAAAI
ncbi:MAG: aldo/keto reductase [Myxococcota bacterium]|nr:aldo/keto reductase [Myxococcota bacterium]